MTIPTLEAAAVTPRILLFVLASILIATARLPALAGPLPLEAAGAELDGPQPRGPGDGVILRHSPLNTGGPASDSDFISATSGMPTWQFLADDILLPTTATVRRVAWWGFYHLDNPPANEVFQIRFLGFLGTDAVTGLPSESTIVQAELHMDVTRAATGRTVFTSIDPPEYRFQVDLAAPLTLEANTTYWLEIAQIGEQQSHYRWEYAVQPANRFAFRHAALPDWQLSALNVDLAFELQTIPEPASIALIAIGVFVLSRRFKG